MESLLWPVVCIAGALTILWWVAQMKEEEVSSFKTLVGGCVVLAALFLLTYGFLMLDLWLDAATEFLLNLIL